MCAETQCPACMTVYNSGLCNNVEFCTKASKENKMCEVPGTTNWAFCACCLRAEIRVLHQAQNPQGSKPAFIVPRKSRKTAPGDIGGPIFAFSMFVKKKKVGRVRQPEK